MIKFCNLFQTTVQLLTTEKPISDLPVQIINGDQNIYGLLKRYDVESKCYEVTLLSNIDKLEDNAKVITSAITVAVFTLYSVGK